MSGGDHFDWSDGVITFLVTESMALKYSAKLHPDIPSITPLYESAEKETRSHAPYYTHRPILLTAVAVPFYYAASILSLNPIPFIGIFVNSFIIVLIALVIFCFALEVYRSRKIAFILGLIFTGCSFILLYNTTLFPQPLQGLCIITAAFFLYKSQNYNRPNIYNSNGFGRRQNNQSYYKGTYFAGLAGLFLGMSVFSHPTSAIFIPGLIVYSFFYMKGIRKKMLGSFLIMLGIVLFLVGLVNYSKSGSFTEFGYGWMASWSTHVGWEGLIGLWASPGAGLIFYFPAVILLPIALKYTYQENRGLLFLTVYIIIVSWVYFGTLSYGGPYWETVTWSGGLAWGAKVFDTCPTVHCHNFRYSYVRFQK